MKLIDQAEIAGATRALGACRCLKFVDLSGTVLVTFNDGLPIRAARGDVFELPPGLQFDRVDVFAANGSSCRVLFGWASFGSSGGGIGAGLAGVDSPEGVVEAEPGTTYYDTAGGLFWVKATGSGNTGWLTLIG